MEIKDNVRVYTHNLKLRCIFPKAKAPPLLLLRGTHTHTSLPFASALGITSPMERILPQQHPTTPSSVQLKSH